MIPYFDIAQGTEQWHEIRDGKPTASQFKRIITAVEGKLSKSCTGYMRELLGDCYVTDLTTKFNGNKNTDRGHELEPEARAEFALLTGLTVVEVGFVTRDDKVVGCSPDGLIWDDVAYDYAAGLEIKCCLPGTHIEIVEEHTRPDGSTVLPDDFKQQVHGGLAVTGLPEWHFFSWCPGMKPFHHIQRPDDYTRKLSIALDEFIISYAAYREKMKPFLSLSPEESRALRARQQERRGIIADDSAANSENLSLTSN